MAIVLGSQGIPIYTGFMGKLAQPINAHRNNFGRKPMSGMAGCGCGPVNGCGCTTSPGMGGYRGRGLGQTASLDQLISNAFSWLGGTVQSSLPASAAVPPQIGSLGALGTTLMQWAPYLIGGYLLYKVVK